MSWKAWKNHAVEKDFGCSSTDEDRFKFTRPKSVPGSIEDVWWTVVRRCGPAWKWTTADLWLLCEELPAEDAEILEAFSGLLKLLGRRLLPRAAGEPVARLTRARPEVQELAGILASLACHPTPENSGDVNQHPRHRQSAPFSQCSERVAEASVEKIDEKVVEVPIEKIVEKIIEIPTEKIVERVVQVPVEKVIEKFVQIPARRPADTCSVDCQAVASIISAETELVAPESEHRIKWKSKMEAHEQKHPGGTLPYELRSFSAYMVNLQKQLDHAEKAKLLCLCCGSFPQG